MNETVKNYRLKIIGESLKSFRLQHDLTLYQMAKAINVRIERVSRIEDGFPVTSEVFISYIDYCRSKGYEYKHLFSDGAL